jgi:hypothetical protein
VSGFGDVSDVTNVQNGAAGVLATLTWAAGTGTASSGTAGTGTARTGTDIDRIRAAVRIAAGWIEDRLARDDTGDNPRGDTRETTAPVPAAVPRRRRRASRARLAVTIGDGWTASGPGYTPPVRPHGSGRRNLGEFPSWGRRIVAKIRTERPGQSPPRRRMRRRW